MIFSNAGTDPQLQAASGSYGLWRSALICAAGTMRAYDQMYCPAGVIDHMRLDPAPGTLTCATYPGAVTTLAATVISVYLSSQGSLISGEYRLGRAMGVSSQGICFPTKPARFTPMAGHGPWVIWPNPCW